MKYFTSKKLNNNVVLVKDETGTEFIFTGNGIGFNAQCNQEFKNLEKVVKRFTLIHEKNQRNFNQMLFEVDNRLIAIIEEEITFFEKELEVDLNENIHITLTDHIAFAIKRHEEKLDFLNPANNDIRFLYSAEYELANHLVQHINQEFKVDLPQDEIGIVAMHIHAAVSNEKIEYSRLRQELIEKIVTAVYKEFKIEKSDSLNYQRFLIHVRYTVERILTKKTIENDLQSYIRLKYKNIYQRMKKIMQQIAIEYNVEISSSEICYLVIHLTRLMHYKN